MEFRLQAECYKCYTFRLKAELQTKGAGKRLLPLAFCLLSCSLLRGGTEFFVELFDERELARRFVIAAQPPQREAELVMRIRAVGRKRDGFLQRIDGFGKLLGLNQGAAQRPV